MIFLINRFSLKDQWFDSHRLTKSNSSIIIFWSKNGRYIAFQFWPLQLKWKLKRDNMNYCFLRQTILSWRGDLISQDKPSSIPRLSWSKAGVSYLLSSLSHRSLKYKCCVPALVSQIKTHTVFHQKKWRPPFQPLPSPRLATTDLKYCKSRKNHQGQNLAY